MALAFQEGASGTAVTSPSKTTAFSAAPAIGDLMVVVTGDDSATTTSASAVTDSAGNTYTEIALPVRAANATLKMWYAPVTATTVSTYQVSVTWNVGNTGRCSIAAHRFVGFTGTPTLDKFTSATGTSTAANSGATAATTNAAEVVVGGGVHDLTASAWTLGAGYTNLSTNNSANTSMAEESKIISSAAAQTATFAIAASRTWVCGVATFYDLVSITPPSSVTYITSRPPWRS